MKKTTFTLNEQDYTFVHNGTAMFELRDRFGEKSVVDLLLADTKEGFDTVCVAAAVLSEQGELVRRYEGHDSGPVLSEDTVRMLATPIDLMKLRLALLEAISTSYGRDITPTGDVDLGLAELNKKKATD